MCIPYTFTYEIKCFCGDRFDRDLSEPDVMDNDSMENAKEINFDEEYADLLLEPGGDWYRMSTELCPRGSIVPPVFETPIGPGPIGAPQNITFELFDENGAHWAKLTRVPPVVNDDDLGENVLSAAVGPKSSAFASEPGRSPSTLTAVARAQFRAYTIISEGGERIKTVQ